MSKVPNFLTISRIILLPLLAFFIINDSQFNALWSIFLFFLISATDFFDGYIARKLNTTSHLGKMLDPIADKLFVTVIIIIFIYTRDIEGYSVIAGTLIILREIFISGLREYAASSNANILEVSKLGKYKTATQILSLFIILISTSFSSLEISYPLGIGLLWIATAMSLISAYKYYNAVFNQDLTN